MAFNLSNAQHNKLDALLGDLLDSYKSGEFTKAQVVGALAHVFTAGVIDNEGEVKAWLEKPEVLQRWKDDTRS
ncbi:hypothetical protein [Mesorhizobium sp.]|uniref:hypothetical protein n=1 Tax=Mesorhizobium sp. TaxID=1871066 RepID=UPI000FE3F420|nr:hypothetical protein [Mesorhizobium sp.]RWH69725.1 MAG: hypothetical protein EOQ84_20625 [Mesorhizobium sp.]RWL28316.1 MAG: hypothetical protein EOR58_12700 [Mesorhizobium sp.]RWL29836.1 MAG: hypothetical protein EOR63_18455 [Mesorhizobium sp.]RWL38174.1 MAG: hypothetical protein EOR59_13610 [Mesorhizobium sp.]RWL52645.1 MAG: hypothetical protein EOR61_18505 [Mesorhizobium sp.]